MRSLRVATIARRVRRLLAASAVGVGVFGLAAAAAAQVELDVQVVHGSNEIEQASMDPACAEIAGRLPMKFKSLRMIKRQRLQLKFGQAGMMSLPTGRRIRLLPISIVKDRLHLHFQMPDVVDTRIQMRTGRPVIVGGEAHERGRIIIMITPTFSAQQGPGNGPSGPDTYRVESRP